MSMFERGEIISAISNMLNLRYLLIQVDIECEVAYSLDLRKMMYAGDTNVGVVSTLMVVEVIRVDNTSQEKCVELKSKGPGRVLSIPKLKGQAEEKDPEKVTGK